MMNRFIWNEGWLEDYKGAAWCNACKEYHGVVTVGRVERIGPDLWLATVFDADGMQSDQADINGTKHQAEEWVLAVARLS